MYESNYDRCLIYNIVLKLILDETQTTVINFSVKYATVFKC